MSTARDAPGNTSNQPGRPAAGAASTAAVITRAGQRGPSRAEGDVRRDSSQGSLHVGGEPVEAAKTAPVAHKAAAIDAAQAHPPTWKTVVKRALAVAVAGTAIYLVLPRLIVVLGAWPRLSTLNPIWFTVSLAAELLSFTCNFALQRLALRTREWFLVVTAGLAGSAS